MRILVVHSRYLSGPISGENRVVDDEVRLLRGAGHKVWLHDPSPRTETIPGLLSTGARAVWSRKAAAGVRGQVAEHAIEVVHAHNLFPALSPAVLRAAVAAGAAPVMSLHNYRLFCMAGTLLRDGRPCELCLGRSPLPGVRYRCYRGSFSGSAAMATSLLVHQRMGTLDRVRLFLPVSRYVAEKHAQHGLPRERMTVKPNFSWPTEVRDGPGSYFLYVGRLSPEKGVVPLVETWPRDVPLVLLGDGPDGARVRATAGRSVQVRGPAEPAEVAAALRGARALVVPSIGPETASRTLVEAASAGVPAIGSPVGGIPEVVEDGRTGALVRPGDAAGLHAAIERLSDDAESLRMGTSAHALWEERFSPTSNLRALEEAYDRALRRSPGSSPM